MSKDLESGYHIFHTHCIASETEGKEPCQSSDALDVREHDREDGSVGHNAYCWSCNQYFNQKQLYSSSVGPELGVDNGVLVNPKQFERKEKPEPLDKEEIKDLIKTKGYSSSNYRGIKDEYHQFYGHLTELNSAGKVLRQYYPETRDGENWPTGYKIRHHPKFFDKVGLTGITSELSGQVKFRDKKGRNILIVAGEADKVAAFQMLAENQKKKGQGDYDPVPVVSPTTGEGSAWKQCKAQYDFLNQFENILIGMDNDEAGRNAAQKIAKVLPKDKVKIITWSGKDPNKMLLDGKERQFLSDFYNAKELVSSGIKDSVDALAEVEEFLTAPKIDLPPYLNKLEEAMRGGIKSTGTILNIVGDTSIGKSFFTDNLTYHWMFESPIVPTIVSLERTAGELATDLLSLHLKKNLTWFSEGMDAVDYLNREDVVEQKMNLFVKEDGSRRFYIIDERDGAVESLQTQTERAAKKYGSRLIIFDPLTDFLRSLGTEAQEDFMMWQKFMKKEGYVFINVLHTRKPPTDKEGKVRKVTEYDILGSGSFVQSADMNIVLNRDKMAEDTIVRNTTCVDMPKCRGGSTGHICDLYYDSETRQQYDFDDFFGNTTSSSEGSEGDPLF